MCHASNVQINLYCVCVCMCVASVEDCTRLCISNNETNDHKQIVDSRQLIINCLWMAYNVCVCVCVCACALCGHEVVRYCTCLCVYCGRKRTERQRHVSLHLCRQGLIQ